MGLEDYIKDFKIKPNVTWADIQYRHFYYIKPSKHSFYTGLEDEENWTGTPNY